jgi:hypothetical protein
LSTGTRRPKSKTRQNGKEHLPAWVGKFAHIVSAKAKTVSIARIALPVCEAKRARQLLLQAKELHEAIKKTRALFASNVGRREYKEQSGIEGTLSQGIRRGMVRHSRY